MIRLLVQLTILSLCFSAPAEDKMKTIPVLYFVFRAIQLTITQVFIRAILILNHQTELRIMCL
jgi:hypothetical protein